MFDIGRHNFLIKMISCTEVNVKARTGVGMGVFSQKQYSVKCV